MDNLIVVGFRGRHRASEVLSQLQVLDDAWTLDLADAVAAYRTDDGRLRIDQSINPTTKQGAALGGVFGALLGGLLAAPFTAGVSTVAAVAAVGTGALGVGSLGALAGADDAASFKEEYGVSDEFVQQVGGMIEPGNSAAFAVIRTNDPEEVARHFQGYGGTILKTTLPASKAAKVQETIGKK